MSCLTQGREGLGVLIAIMRENRVVTLVLAFTRHTGARLAELGFLFILLAGAWLAAASRPKASTLRLAGGTVGGLGLALGGLLVIIAIHWGHFG
jgi:hypothetical protein